MTETTTRTEALSHVTDEVRDRLWYIRDPIPSLERFIPSEPGMNPFLLPFRFALILSTDGGGGPVVGRFARLADVVEAGSLVALQGYVPVTAAICNPSVKEGQVYLAWNVERDGAQVAVHLTNERYLVYRGDSFTPLGDPHSVTGVPDLYLEAHAPGVQPPVEAPAERAWQVGDEVEVVRHSTMPEAEGFRATVIRTATGHPPMYVSVRDTLGRRWDNVAELRLITPAPEPEPTPAPETADRPWRVGDRVQIVAHFSLTDPVGRLGTIVEVDPRYEPLGVSVRDDGGARWNNCSELRLLTPTSSEPPEPRPWRIGDRVTIVRHPDHPECEGRLGRVTEVVPGGNHPLGVTVQDDEGGRWAHVTELRLVEPDSAQEPVVGEPAPEPPHWLRLAKNTEPVYLSPFQNRRVLVTKVVQGDQALVGTTVIVQGEPDSSGTHRYWTDGTSTFLGARLGHSDGIYFLTWEGSELTGEPSIARVGAEWYKVADSHGNPVEQEPIRARVFVPSLWTPPAGERVDVAALLAESARLEEFWDRFSEASNEMATNEGWCPNFERAVQPYGFPGRESLAQDWEVTVRITAEVDLHDISSRIDTMLEDNLSLGSGVSVNSASLSLTTDMTITVSGVTRDGVDDYLELSTLDDHANSQFSGSWDVSEYEIISVESADD